MKISFCLPLMLLVFLGCKKDKKEVSKETIKMSFDGIEQTSAMKVFRSGGTLIDAEKDKVIIADFLKRKYSVGATQYNSGFAEPNEAYGKDVNFIFYDTGRITYAAEIIGVKKIGETTVMKSAVVNDIEPIVTSDLFKYKFEINNNNSYNYQYVLHRNDRSLELSLLYYKLVRYNENGELKQIAFGTVHNELNPAFLQSLTKNDTLAVKAYVIKYAVK